VIVRVVWQNTGELEGYRVEVFDGEELIDCFKDTRLKRIKETAKRYHPKIKFQRKMEHGEVNGIC